MTSRKYPCMILCAGTSRRFGSNKMLANLAGKLLLQHVIERVEPQVSDLAINGSPHTYRGFGLDVLPDIIEGQLGPLAGILTAMEWAAGQGRSRVLTVSGDTPFVPKDWALKLAGTPDNAIAMPQVDGRSQQVCGLWPSALVPDLRKFLQAGESYKVRGFLARHKTEMVGFSKIDGVDPFFNINTRADMERAELLLPLPLAGEVPRRGDGGAHLLCASELSSPTITSHRRKSGGPPSPTQELRHFPREKQGKE